MIPADSRVYRARRFPGWLSVGMAMFLFAVVVVLGASLLQFGPGETSGMILGIIAVTLFVSLTALLILKIGIDVLRSRVAFRENGIDATLNRFKIWGIRWASRADLAWPDILAVQRYEIPNPMARAGVQVDYVLHTTKGLFAVSSLQFRQAEDIAQAIASAIHRSIDDIPEGIEPVGATRAVDRRGARAMRALGWVSLSVGMICPALLAMVWLSGGTIEGGEIGGMTAASTTLLFLGRSLVRFSLK